MGLAVFTELNSLCIATNFSFYRKSSVISLENALTSLPVFLHMKHMLALFFGTEGMQEWTFRHHWPYHWH